MSMSSHKQLLYHCVQALSGYNREMHSVEEYIEKYIKTEKVADDSDQNFIKEVFSGCVQYTGILQAVLNGFFVRDGKRMLHSEVNLYLVICYLSLFRLDELGMAHYRKFVRSQDINKMYRFLNFFLDEKNLTTWIKDAWEKIYEQLFVQTTLISPLIRWMPELQEMLQLMKSVIENKQKPKKRTAKTTEMKPFNITKPRPRSIPLPEPIPNLHKHKPPPTTLYQEPSEMEMLRSARDANRRMAEERLMEASRIQFACANPEKSQKTKEILSNIAYEKENQLDFNKHNANPAPSFLSQEVPVKMNAAAILREGRLYQKREEAEIKKIQRLEAGARDTTEFLSWQTEMRQKDLESQLADIERRRLEGKLSHEEAILARQNLIKDNKQKVQEMKEETKIMMQEYLEQKFKEETEMRQLVENTMLGHKSTKDSKKKLQEYKQKLVQQINEESRELMRQALEEAEAEMRRKMELIHQIRAMEAVPVIRQKFVDFTATSGAGLLSEMSIAELRERLAWLKTAEKESEEMRRDDILANKQAKDQLLLDTLETISKHRLEQTKSAATRLECRKRGETKKPEIKNEKLSELQQKLEEKRAERLQEQKNNKINATWQSGMRTKSLISQKKALEENRWQELELTRERTAKLMVEGSMQSKNASRLAAPSSAIFAS